MSDNIWHELSEEFKQMDRERGFIMPLDSTLYAILLDAKRDGKLEEKLSEPGWEVYRPEPENYPRVTADGILIPGCLTK
jgi:hypothetical protein